MKNATLPQVVWCALLIGCARIPKACATEPVTSGTSAGSVQSSSTEAISSRERPHRGSAGMNSGTGPAKQAMTLHDERLAPNRSSRRGPGTHAFMLNARVGSSVRGYSVRRPDASHSDRSTGWAVPVATAGTAIARGMKATTSSNASRSLSGVFGANSRLATSFKPIVGNGILGGPPNSRTAIKASIDGTAFHHR
jgi:hypothetical protein